MQKKCLLSLIEALREAVPRCHSRKDLEPNITRQESYTHFVAALAELPIADDAPISLPTYRDRGWKGSRNGRMGVYH